MPSKERPRPSTWLTPEDPTRSWWIDQLRLFGGVYEEIGLNPSDFTGDILAGGIGPVFPERIFFCDPQDGYKRLSSDVTKLVCCDTAGYPPEMWILNEDVSVVHLYDGSTQVPLPDRATYVEGSIWQVLEQVDQEYDAITFCRIPNLPQQIRDDGLALIANRLKPGGMALLSGSLFFGDWRLNKLVEKARQDMPSVETVFTELRDTGDLLNAGAGEHFGVVMRKR